MIGGLIKKLLEHKKINTQFNEISNAKDIELKKQSISPNLEKMIDIFNHIYSIPLNKDVIIRTINIGGLNIKAATIAINSISDYKIIEEHLLSPLLTNENSEKEIEDLIEFQSLVKIQMIQDAIDKINDGGLILIVDGFPFAYGMTASAMASRQIDKPENELTLKGSKEGFTEKLNVNVSLIRKRIKNESLIFETSVISKRARNQVSIVYLKDLTNETLLLNIREKLAKLDVDSIHNIALLEQYIEDRKTSLFPTVLYTERPDRAVSYIDNGYIVLIMDNSPAALVVPATFWSFYHTAEDHYMRFIPANFTRLMRMMAIFITLFMSAIYVAMTSFHAEMIPHDLLLAIAATRERVPFPAFVEVFLMEIAFDLIREAGLRVPAPIGPTIGIVGALILGQAAVQANIVSPIVVIVVALAGLCSFILGDVNMDYSIRLSRYFFIMTAALFGIYGMTAGFVIGIFYLVSLKSFGVPYLAPFTPRYFSSNDSLFRRLLQDEVFRPGYLKPKDMKKN
ncbi:MULTISPECIES: spore germination protein [unclassified Bacillus (in: firmicutes)]|uniref:spore germination protein n=1 Tax=unclassified Bacillus (in: firmicutes) TaxID=185979 RepID=UPI002FFDCCFD